LTPFFSLLKSVKVSSKVSEVKRQAGIDNNINRRYGWTKGGSISRAPGLWSEWFPGRLGSGQGTLSS